MVHYLAGQVVGMVIGFGVCAFTPRIGRLIKSVFVGKTQAAEATIKSTVTGVANDIKKKL